MVRQLIVTQYRMYCIHDCGACSLVSRKCQIDLHYCTLAGSKGNLNYTIQSTAHAPYLKWVHANALNFKNGVINIFSNTFLIRGVG